MHIRHTDPWTLMNGIGRNVDRILLGARSERGTAAWVPPVDIREFDDRFEIVADIPGISADRLDITLEDGVLTLAGERGADVTDGSETHRAERASGRFQRQFRLPDTTAADGLSATYTNGVVTIAIPKRPQAAPYRVEVKVN